MVRKTSEWIAKWCLISGEEGEENEEIVRFGIEVILESIIKYAILLCIGITLGMLGETLLVLLSFSGIRLFAGGIHAKTGTGCTLMMTSILIISLGAGHFPVIPLEWVAICFVFCSLILYGYAPNGSKANDLLNPEEKEKKKKQAIVMLGCFSIVSVYEGGRNFIVSAMVAEILTVIKGGFL